MPCPSAGILAFLLSFSACAYRFLREMISAFSKAFGSITEGFFVTGPSSERLVKRLVGRLMERLPGQR
jgi:hypothetical protein